MFHGRWERQAKRLPLCSCHSPLELRPPLCRTNLGNKALLGPSSAVCSHSFVSGNRAPSSAPWRPFHHLLSLLHSSTNRRPLLPKFQAVLLEVLMSILDPSWPHADSQAAMLLQMEESKLHSAFRPGWVIWRKTHHLHQQGCQHSRSSLGRLSTWQLHSWSSGRAGAHPRQSIDAQRDFPLVLSTCQHGYVWL